MAKIELIGEFEGRRVARMLQQLYLGGLAHNERFEVTGWMDGGWANVRFLLTDDEHSYPVEARLHAHALDVRPQQAKDVLVDLLGHFFGLYLNDDRAPFTGPKWEQVDMGGMPVFLRGQELHHIAEADASALLAAAAVETANAISPPAAAVDE